MITIRRAPFSAVALLLGMAGLTSMATASSATRSQSASVVARIDLTGHPLSAPLAVPSRHLVYVPHGRYRRALAVDTATGSSKRIVGKPENGAVVNPSTGYLYMFAGYERGVDEQHSGVHIVDGTGTVKHLRLGVGDAVNLGHGVTGLLTTPSVNAPNSRYRLLRYRGAKLLSNTQICAGLSTDVFSRGQSEMFYDATSGLFYVACHEWLPRKHPEVQVFRGPRVVKTFRHVPGDFFERDAKRDLVYLISPGHVHVFRGTDLLGNVAIPGAQGQEAGPQTSGIDPTSGDLYLGTGAPDAELSIVRRTHLVTSAHTPSRTLVVDQETGVAYDEHKRGDGYQINRFRNGTRLPSMSTDAALLGYDPISQDLVASGPDGLEFIKGTHVMQTVPVGANPRIEIVPSAHRIYVVSHHLLTILRTN